MSKVLKIIVLMIAVITAIIMADSIWESRLIKKIQSHKPAAALSPVPKQIDQAKTYVRNISPWPRPIKMDAQGNVTRTTSLAKRIKDGYVMNLGTKSNVSSQKPWTNPPTKPHYPISVTPAKIQRPNIDTEPPPPIIVAFSGDSQKSQGMRVININH